MMTEKLEHSYTLKMGDILNVDVTLTVDDIVVPFTAYKICLTRTTENDCRADLFAVQNSMDDTMYGSIVRSVRDSVNKELISLAEKRGGFLSAKEMSEYIQKQDFIRELKRK